MKSYKYDHLKIEKKWQKFWLKNKSFEAENPRQSASSQRESAIKPKFYGLIEFPYPSGDGLHVGHIRSNTAMDIISRKRRMEGYNVLYPIGWDAFGLPTENYAIKTGIQPAKVTKINTDIFRKQLQSLGFSFDWSREINTTDPKYYKWTQWIFLQMFKAGLAYKKKMAINWCPKDKIGLANEEVINGCCERCGTPVEKREKEQWMLAITKYADRLDKDLDTVDYLPQIKIQQRNWIGRSHGSLIGFKLRDSRTNADLTRTDAEGKQEVLSYLMGVENIDSNLRDIGVKIIEKTDGGDYKIIIPKEKISDYEKLISEKLQPGFWNEYLSDKAIFIFKDKLGKISRFVWDELNEGQLLDLCNEYAKPSEKFTSIEEMLSDNDWYSSLRLSASSLRQSATSITIDVFTTRADTLFGVTYLVLSPEHEIIQNLKIKIENWGEVEKYINDTKKKTDIDRTDIKKEKTGIKLDGLTAINPANNEEVPIWIADYVLADYGTGAIMAVPAHDERDFEFAKKYNLPLKKVIEPLDINIGPGGDAIQPELPFVERNNVVCIVKHPDNDQFLITKWKQVLWNGFVTGGIDEGKTAEESARAEVLEETGYNDIATVKVFDDSIHARFYHVVKKQNRFAHYRIIEVVLGSFKQVERSKEEDAIHEPVWLNKKDVREILTRPDMKAAWDTYNGNLNCFTDEGVIINSGEFPIIGSEEAKKKITEFVHGKIVTTYKLRDWVFSRQRYWGEPIPLIFCEECAKKLEESRTNADLTQTDADKETSKGEEMNPGWIPIPEKDLPVELPKVKNYQPTDTGESPLAGISKWVNVKCPQCGGPAKRETDTMPNWAGSSWYYLAYTSQGISNFELPKPTISVGSPTVNVGVSKPDEEFKYWLPVDWYNGGMEHTTLHLLYSRFWHKFLFDQGLVPTNEPYKKRTSHGLILAKSGEKMSKSKGNVVNPDDIVKTWGADSLRLYEMFMGPFGEPVSWNTDSIMGVRRFLEKIWRLMEKIENRKIENRKLENLLNKTVQKVSEDIEDMKFNTAVSTMMILVNEFGEQKMIEKSNFETFLKLLSPFAPHIAEEIWSELDHKQSIFFESWPKADENIMTEKNVNVVVQINGKVRGLVEIPVDSQESIVISKIKEDSNIQKWLSNREIKKIIYVKNRLINIVI